MKRGILSTAPGCYSTRRFGAAAKDRGCKVAEAIVETLQSKKWSLLDGLLRFINQRRQTEAAGNARSQIPGCD